MTNQNFRRKKNESLGQVVKLLDSFVCKLEIQFAAYFERTLRKFSQIAKIIMIFQQLEWSFVQFVQSGQ